MSKSPQKVFLDANVLIQEGKEGSPIIERLVDLVDAGLASILTTDLTMTEVAKKHAENDLNVVKDFARPHFRAILKDVLGKTLPAINKATLKDSLFDKYRKSTARLFTALDATILSIDNVRPSDVFGAYSKREGFFSGEGKKNQFPDAFIFECLVSITTEKSPIIIVSSDGDFVEPVKTASNISIVQTFADLFATLGLEIEAPEIEEFFDDHHDDLVSRFDRELSDWGLQVSDVEDAEIDETTATNVKLKQFTAFRSTQDGGNILVAGYATVTADVSYTHPNWDTAIWDSEDKVPIPYEEISGEREIELEIRFSMTLSVDESGKPITVDKLSFLDDSFVYVKIDPYETFK